MLISPHTGWNSSCDRDVLHWPEEELVEGISWCE